MNNSHQKFTETIFHLTIFDNYQYLTISDNKYQKTILNLFDTN
jgi:hypothetical protein